MRKQIMAVATVALASLTALPEGYQVNSLSSKQIGMGHTGIAMQLGAESMFFNPAGMAYMDKTMDLSGSFTGIISEAKVTTTQGVFKTDNPVSTPIFAGTAFKIYDNLKAGVSFYTPYGSGVNWGDNWPGAVLNQNVKLRVYTLQPTLAWAINDKFSIGAGAMISWGSVDLNKALVSAETADLTIAIMKQMGKLPAQTPAFGHTTPASVNLTGTADAVVGVNVGAMYNVNNKISIGANFRSQMAMRVKKGDASVTYANNVAQNLLNESLDLINNANFSAEMPCPWVFGIGVSYKPIQNLTLAFDAKLTGWHTYKNLDIEFLADQLSDYNQHITKDYSNAWCFSIGAQYALTSRLDIRAGVMIDTTPVNDKYYNPETPGMTKIEPTVGFSFRPLPEFSIDLGFMYAAGLGRDNATCEYPDMLGAKMTQTLTGAGIPAEQVAAMGFSNTGHFSADYSVNAFIPSIGISYRF